MKEEVRTELSRRAWGEMQSYRARMGLSVVQLADRIGMARKSLMHFHGGFYGENEDKLSDIILGYIRANPVPAPAKPGKLYNTANVRLLDELMGRARAGEWCLVFGAPGTQKSFVFETRWAESYSPAGEAGVIYVYASAGMSPSALLKRIARGLGALAQGHRDQVIDNILHGLSRQPAPPVLVVDEAHHLGGMLETLETLREVGDRGRIGMIVAGHDDLESVFRDASGGPFEQWRSRFDRRERLPGLSEQEVEMIARAELGPIPAVFVKRLLQTSAVPHCGFKYLSARELFKEIRGVKQELAAKAKTRVQ